MELEQSRDEQQTIKQRADDLDKACRTLDAEKETLKSTVEMMERALEQKETKIERSLKDVVALKEDMDRRLFDKEEELQNMRYAGESRLSHATGGRPQHCVQPSTNEVFYRDNLPEHRCSNENL